MHLCCRDRARFKAKHAAPETATFFNFSYIFMLSWGSMIFALIRSNGHVLVEPEKCLEPSLLTSTDSHVFCKEDSREQRGCTTQTLIPSLCRIQVAKRGTSFAILQLTRFTLHWDPTQTSYKNAKLRPKTCLWSVLGNMINTPGKYESKSTPSMNITRRQSLNCELPSDHFAANPSSGPHVFTTTSVQKSRTLKNCSCRKNGQLYICKWGQ